MTGRRGGYHKVTYRANPKVVAAHTALMRALAAVMKRGSLVPCQEDPDSWYAPDKERGLDLADALDAARLCRTSCPAEVREACGSYADVAKETVGVWGGELYPRRRGKRR